MIDYKIILGFVAVAIGLVAYVPYLRDIVKGKIRPHAFSWFIWGLSETIVFVAQTVKHGGAGTWVIGTTAIVCFSFSIYAFFKGENLYTKLDWVAFGGALLAIALWRLTHDPLVAVILIILTDALGFVPTFRKSFYKPFEETISMYFLSSVKVGVAFFALQSFSLTVILFPIYTMLANLVFIAMVVTRRSKLKK